MTNVLSSIEIVTWSPLLVNKRYVFLFFGHLNTNVRSEALFSQFTDILDGVLERHKLLSTTTPPPSPTRQAIGSPAHSSPKPGMMFFWEEQVEKHAIKGFAHMNYTLLKDYAQIIFIFELFCVFIFLLYLNDKPIRWVLLVRLIETCLA